jgi:uncharacterized damage-inducible protein DinB
MVDFVRNPDYKELEWPKDYWPGNGVNPTKKMWDNSITEFNKHMSDFEAMVNSPEFDLTAPIKHGTGQTVLREVLQIIDHNSYHIGQIISMRRALGAWK